MSAHEAIHVQVYQVLDVVLASRAVPPGAKGAMFSAVDQLRVNPSSDKALVVRAERISLEIHRLELGLRTNDEPAVADARNALKSLAFDWLDARISSREAPSLASRGHRDVC
jgi:hypothetical protein